MSISMGRECVHQVSRTSPGCALNIVLTWRFPNIIIIRAEDGRRAQCPFCRNK